MTPEEKMVQRFGAALVPVFRRCMDRLINLIPEITMAIQNAPGETPGDESKPEPGKPEGLGPSPLRSQYAEWYNRQRNAGEDSQRAYSAKGDKLYINNLEDGTTEQPGTSAPPCVPSPLAPPPGGWDVPKCGLGPLDNKSGYTERPLCWVEGAAHEILDIGQIFNGGGVLWMLTGARYYSVVNGEPNIYHFNEFRPQGDYTDSADDVAVILASIRAVMDTRGEL